MNESFESVDWGKELQSLVSLAKTPEERKASLAFANALAPYLDDPTMLKTLLGKIMQSPSEVVGVVAKERKFNTLEEVEAKVGSSVRVIPL